MALQKTCYWRVDQPIDPKKMIFFDPYLDVPPGVFRRKQDEEAIRKACFRGVMPVHPLFHKVNGEIPAEDPFHFAIFPIQKRENMSSCRTMSAGIPPNPPP
eukprot:scaffold7769_cov53-Attheya_sp.AAC.9